MRPMHEGMKPPKRLDNDLPHRNCYITPPNMDEFMGNDALQFIRSTLADERGWQNNSRSKNADCRRSQSVRRDGQPNGLPYAKGMGNVTNDF